MVSSLDHFLLRLDVKYSTLVTGETGRPLSLDIRVYFLNSLNNKENEKTTVIVIVWKSECTGTSLRFSM
jgi:hypothetical protein